MFTITNLNPTATYRNRQYAYARIGTHDLADGYLTLKVQRGNREIDTTYALQCERDETGILHTIYLAKERSEDGEVYGIEFTPRGSCRCSCLGFTRHGQCKHADAVSDLLRKGQLHGIRFSREAQCIAAERIDVTPSSSSLGSS